MISMKLNDCDHPKKMELTLKKISDGTIYVQYALNSMDINSPKKILEIVLEHTILPKKYTEHIPKKQDKKMKKKKKREKKKKK